MQLLHGELQSRIMYIDILKFDKYCINKPTTGDSLSNIEEESNVFPQND